MISKIDKFNLLKIWWWLFLVSSTKADRQKYCTSFPVSWVPLKPIHEAHLKKIFIGIENDDRKEHRQQCLAKTKDWECQGIKVTSLWNSILKLLLFSFDHSRVLYHSYSEPDTCLNLTHNSRVLWKFKLSQINTVPF